MITDKDKYRAQCYQIGGFALMSPLGKTIMDLRSMSPGDYSFVFFVYCIGYITLFLCGMLLIDKGLYFLDEERK